MKKIDINVLANDLKKFSSSEIDTLFLDEIHYSKKVILIYLII